MLIVTALIDKSWQENPSPPTGILKWCDPIFVANRTVRWYRKTMEANPFYKDISRISTFVVSYLLIIYLTPLFLTSSVEAMDRFAFTCFRGGEFGAIVATFSEIHKTLQIAILILFSWKGCKKFLEDFPIISSLSLKWSKVFQQAESTASLRARIDSRLDHWLEKVDESPEALLVCKQEVIQYSTLLCEHIFRFSRKHFPDQALLNQLQKAKESLEEIMEKIAKVEDRSDATFCSAFVLLGEKGIRVREFEFLAAKAGWSRSHYPFISIKLAAIGIISNQDIVRLSILKTSSGIPFTTEGIKLRLAELIQNADLSIHRHYFLLAFINTIQTIERLSILLFSSVFVPFSFFFNSFHIHPLTIAEGLLLGFQGYKINILNLSELEQGTVLRRALFFENFSLQAIVAYRLGKIMRKFFKT